MNWVHLEQYQPEWDAAYAVSDGDYVGIGIWMGHEFAWVFLDDEDMSDHNYDIDPTKFVYWATLCVQRFGVNKHDPSEFQMLHAEDVLRCRMRIMEKFGPDMLKDDDEP
jgi:hypothetical protein